MVDIRMFQNVIKTLSTTGNKEAYSQEMTPGDFWILSQKGKEEACETYNRELSIGPK